MNKVKIEHIGHIWKIWWNLQISRKINISKIEKIGSECYSDVNLLEHRMLYILIKNVHVV